MYQALYRKYRPKTFDDVVGQNVIVQTLKNSILNNKISHAYLFSGPRGCGKTSLAKIFARLVNCEHPNGTNPCGECVCCTQTDDQNLDIIEMDAASNNGVDEIREINNKVNLVPSVGKYKVYIIDEVHMLTIGAFNALLKTLEEPPSHVIFILATTDPNKVPITILSRCQRFDLKKISEENICTRIESICKEENIKISKEALHEVARLGDGSLRDTLSVLDQVISYSQGEINVDTVHDVNGSISQKDISMFMNKVLNNDISGVLNTISSFNANGKNIIKITEEIILYLRNAILYKTAPTLVDGEVYKSVADKLTVETLIDYIKKMNETILDMKKFSNSKMLLELAMISIMNIEDTGNVAKSDSSVKPEENNFPGNKTVDITEKSETHVDNKPTVDEQLGNEKNVKSTTLNVQNVSKSTDLSKLDQFIDTRVSNTLSQFSKKQTTDMKKQIDKLSDYVMDEKYGSIASMILDGELKAVGDNYMIFTFNTSALATLFNENINNIEELLSTVFENKYKVIAVDSARWDDIKEVFNTKKVKYTFEEEKYTIDEVLEKNKSNDNMQSLFGDIVEYE